MQHTHKISAGAISSTVGYLANDVILATRKLCRTIPAVLALAGLFGASAVAQAGTVVNVTFQGQDPNATPTSGMVVRLYDQLNSSGTPNTPAMTAVRLNEGGAFDFKVNNPSSTQFMGPGGSTSSTGVLSFCIEMTEFIQNGPTNLAMIPLANAPAQVSGPNMNGMGATSAMLIEELWGKYINNVLNPPAGLTTSQAAGAFQLAIWKLEYDGSDPYGTPGSVNFGKGYVEAHAKNASDATVLSTASNWINSLSLNPSSGELADLVALSSANYQDQVCQIVTPEPSSNLIWLVVAAIGVYPIMRRRNSAA
jgi:hypothetical protein